MHNGLFEKFLFDVRILFQGDHLEAILGSCCLKDITWVHVWRVKGSIMPQGIGLIRRRNGVIVTQRQRVNLILC